MLFEKAFNTYYREGVYLNLESAESGVIKHLTHLDELVLTQKQQGVTIAQNFIQELKNALASGTSQKVFTTVKYDGAPAIIAGYNPENNKFFVATKSVANVNPKINYTPADVVANHGNAPGLAEKLKMALMYLPEVIKSGIYQGDFMFDKSTLSTVEQNGERLITFKPNTIVYAVPENSEAGHAILRAKIGVVFHTKYTGPSLSQLSSNANVNVNEFGKNDDVWLDDAMFKDVTGVATLTEQEVETINNEVEGINVAARTVKWDALPESFYTYANTFINTLIREGRFITDPVEAYDEFNLWVAQRYNKEVGKLKTERGKAQKESAKEQLLKVFAKHKKDILNIFNITTKISDIKKIFINKYNSAIKTRHFIAEPNGNLKVTAPEGYVAVDHKGNKVKLVDRLEFSRANFAIPKGQKFS